MMKIDVGNSDNQNSCDHDFDNNGTKRGANDDECSGRRGHRGCLLLEFLPRDLLTQSILGRYLDGMSLSNFWCATMSKRELAVRRNSPRGKGRSSRTSQSLSMVEEIHQIIQRRRAFLTEEETSDHSTTNQQYHLRRKVFQAFHDAVASQTPDNIANGVSLLSNDTHGRNETTSGQKDSEEIEIGNDGLFHLGRFLILSRNIFGSLSAINYCERVPHNLIWCGILRVRHHGTVIQTDDTEPIKVALVVHPRRWSMKEIRLWRNATTWSASSGPNTNKHSPVTERRQATVKANVTPYNFLPVGPTRGRLVGLTESDRHLLEEISDRLNRSELVGRFSCMIRSSAIRNADNTSASATEASITDNNTSRNCAGQFTVKLLAFDQAQRKLNTVFRRGYEPGGIPLREEKDGMVLHGNHTGVDHDRNSLLCCWNHEFLWEDSRSFQLETAYALRDTMNEYDKLVQ